MAKFFPHEVYVDTDRPAFPPMCICCGEPSDTFYRPLPPKRRLGMPETEEELRYPYCRFCLDHVRTNQSVSLSLVVALNIAVWGLAFPLIGGVTGVFLATGPAIGGAYALLAVKRGREQVSTREECVCRDPACRPVWYRRQTYMFSFASKAYAGEFQKLNEDLVVKEP